MCWSIPCRRPSSICRKVLSTASGQASRLDKTANAVQWRSASKNGVRRARSSMLNGMHVAYVAHGWLWIWHASESSGACCAKRVQACLSASSTVARGSNAAPPPETPPGLHEDSCCRAALLCARCRRLGGAGERDGRRTEPFTSHSEPERALPTNPVRPLLPVMGPSRPLLLTKPK